MAWSTRQLADLAGTTVKAVRHYHETGLLELPGRTANGYKQYEVPHLVRLLQIKRLTDLGVPLAQVATIGTPELETQEAVRALDADLEATIDRLTRIRSELAVIVREGAPVDVPGEFGQVAEPLSDADRAMLLISARIYSEGTMRELREMLKTRDATDDEFDALPPDADPATVQALAERVAQKIRWQEEHFPALARPDMDSPTGATVARTTMAEAVVHLYNPAQRQVIRVAGYLAHPERLGQ